MIPLLNFITTHIDYLMLLFLRMASLLFVAQIFGRNNIPAITKIGLSIALTYLVYLWAPPVTLEYTTIWGYAGLCVAELLIGVVLGYVFNMFFMLTYTAGAIIDMQLGFSMINVYDPLSNMQVPIMGNALNLLLMILFFQVNGHLHMIRLLMNSTVQMPVGRVVFNAELAMVALEAFIRCILIAVSVAMPVLAAALVIEIAMGILIRTAPQMNMFVVGIPLKILIGFMIIIASIPVFGNFSGTIFDTMFEFVDKFFMSMHG